MSVCTVGGTALDWPQYSEGGYAATQAEAKREQRGMWAGRFKEPWTYRGALAGVGVGLRHQVQADQAAARNDAGETDGLDPRLILSQPDVPSVPHVTD